jgi:cytochrome c-type biogenesis protein CcmH/NrfF
MYLTLNDIATLVLWSMAVGVLATGAGLVVWLKQAERSQRKRREAERERREREMRGAV